jgi:outer membrane protein OmpA-like peptidoglycan-associated protein/tetratricopeptide (TPR) repeat protein
MNECMAALKKTEYRKGFWILFLLLFIGSVVLARPDRRIQRWFEEARQHLYRQEYAQAISLCEQILDRDSAFLDARLLLADIYYETGNSEREIIHLKEALKISHMPLILRRLGEAYYSIGSYSEALACFEKYMNEAEPDKNLKNEVQRKTESCRFALHAMQNPVEFHPERLPHTVNSAFDEYWPSLSIDQQELVITRLIREPGKRAQEDFYISRLAPDGWEKAVPVPDINTSSNEGAQSLSADGKVLFFTACNRAGGMGSCDIYYSVRRNGRWGSPVNPGSPLNTASWEAQPSISSDGRFLYFTSNRPGGKGEKDLWRAECLGFNRKGELRWDNPENLGDSINTPGNETSPFIHAGNTGFYFASDDHLGMGGFDLFVSHILNDSVFSAPENLGYPINTFNDEQGLHISADGFTAFFSSARDSISGLDIFAFKLDESMRPNPATYVKARVSDAETNEPVQALIHLVNLADRGEPDRAELTDEQGNLLLCLQAGKNYSFSVSKEGYLFYSNTFDLRESRHYYDPYQLEIALVAVKAGAEMDLHNIYFKTDSFNILPESETELQELVAFLKDNPSIEAEIQGHTDNTGPAANNLELSNKRAQSVMDYLVLHGIDKRRLESAGYGEEKPVAGNDTEEGRRMNRRTTIKILGD